MAAPWLALFAVGCGAADPTAAPGEAKLDADRFAEVYVELRAAALDASTRAEFEEKRQEILQRHGVTAEGLLEFAESHGSDARRMATLWDSMSARLTARDTAQNGS